MFILVLLSTAIVGEKRINAKTLIERKIMKELPDRVVSRNLCFYPLTHLTYRRWDLTLSGKKYGQLVSVKYLDNVEFELWVWIDWKGFRKWRIKRDKPIEILG